MKMAYLVRIENNRQGNMLIKYLKTLNFAKVIGGKDLLTSDKSQLLDLFTIDGNQIDIKQFNMILADAEGSNDISLEDALNKSAEWKTKPLSNMQI